MSSIASTASRSVSYFGEEVELEVAINKTFDNLQTELNYCQCSTRELAMGVNNDADYEYMVETQQNICDYVDKMVTLFKELKSVVKQTVGKPKTDEEKEWLKEFKEKLKIKSSDSIN